VWQNAHHENVYYTGNKINYCAPAKFQMGPGKWIAVCVPFGVCARFAHRWGESPIACYWAQTREHTRQQHTPKIKEGPASVIGNSTLRNNNKATHNVCVCVAIVPFSYIKSWRVERIYWYMCIWLWQSLEWNNFPSGGISQNQINSSSKRVVPVREGFPHFLPP